MINSTNNEFVIVINPSYRYNRASKYKDVSVVKRNHPFNKFKMKDNRNFKN
jgi:hypothetical protein